MFFSALWPESSTDKIRIRSLVNEHLQKHTTKCAYFYCDFSDEANTTSLRSIVGSIMAQLLYSAPEGPAKAILCKMLFERKKSGLPLSGSKNDLTLMVIMACRLYNELAIVVDGLDECSVQTREDIILCLTDHDVLTSPKKRARIYFSSRDEVDIREHFNRIQDIGYSFYSISLSGPVEGKHLQNDIKAYISTRLRKIVDSHCLDEKTKVELEDRVMDGLTRAGTSEPL